MNHKKLESLLKEINPRYRIRQRGYGHVGGIFIGDKDFKLTLSKGHIPLNTYRLLYIADDKKKERVIKRGRGDILKILRARKLISHYDSVRLKYGISKG
jgi:hypothetical protein